MIIDIVDKEHLLDALERLVVALRTVNDAEYLSKDEQVTVDLSAYLTAAQIANSYVAKDGSKVLSTNDFTTAEKNKLAGIATNANNYTYTLPAATASTLGGVKLYSATGTNTDGTMTQAAINSALSNFSADVILGTTPLTVEGGVWADWS